MRDINRPMKTSLVLVGLLSIVTQAQAATVRHSSCLVSQINGVAAPLSDMDENAVLFQGLRDKGYDFRFADGSIGLNFEFGSSLEVAPPIDGYMTYESAERSMGEAELIRQVQLTANDSNAVLFSKYKSIPVVNEVSDEEAVHTLKWALKKLPNCEKVSLVKKSAKNAK